MTATHRKGHHTAHRAARRRPGGAAAAIVAVAALALAGCGSDGSDASAGATTTTAGTSSTSAVATTTAAVATTTPTSTTTGPVDPADLPGQPFDLYPYEGATLAVVGVEPDDVLNLRTGPGTDFPVAYALAPTVDDIEASGTNRQLDDGTVWAEVGVAGHGGWANVAFLAQLGVVTDITADLGPAASGETMVGLAEAVAEQRVSGEPRPRVTVAVAPAVGDVGDVGEITVDVLGIGDDALLGERLHIVGTPNPDGETFTTKSVEATALCLRGVTAEGLCV